MKFKIGDLVILRDRTFLAKDYLPLADDEVGAICLVTKTPEDNNPFYYCTPADDRKIFIQALEDEMELLN